MVCFCESIIDQEPSSSHPVQNTSHIVDFDVVRRAVRILARITARILHKFSHTMYCTLTHHQMAIVFMLKYGAAATVEDLVPMRIETSLSLVN